MSTKLYTRLLQGLGLVPKASSENAVRGDLEVLTTGKMYLHNGTINDAIVQENIAATLTNKTIDADNNTISDLTNANLKNGVAGITNANLAVMPTLTIKGNDGLSSLVPQDLTVAEVNTMLGTTGAPTSIGNLDSQAPNAQGLALVGQVLSTQSATASVPGMVNNTSQTLSGQKTFSTGISVGNLNLTQAVDSSSTGALVNVAAPTVGTIIFTNASLASIQTIGAGATGRVLTIKNSTGNTITIKNDSGGTAANRIVTGLGIDITLVNTASLLLEYDGTASRWTVIGGSGGSSTFIVYDDFNITDDITTTLNLSATPASVVNTNMYINGVYQEKSSYSLLGNVITLSPPRTGDTVEVVTGVSTTATITGNLTVFSDTGDGVTTGPYTLSVSPGSTNNTFVYLGGVYQNKSTYSITGTDLNFTTAPPNGVSIEVVIPSITDIGAPSNGTVTTSTIVDGNVTQAKLSTALQSQLNTNWASYTPVFTGFGTVTGINMRWRLVGKSVQIKGVFQTGTTTSTEFRMSLPSGITSSSSIATLETCGTHINSTASTNNHGGFVLIEPSVSYVTFSTIDVFGSSPITPLSKTTVSGSQASNSIYSINADIQID
jgi:hypothetical protein